MWTSTSSMAIRKNLHVGVNNDKRFSPSRPTPGEECALYAQHPTPHHKKTAPRNLFVSSGLPLFSTLIGALTIVQEDVAPIRQNSTVCQRNFPCRLPLSAKDLYIMKRDMNIMESVNNPFAPCFRAAHTLATPPPLRRHHSPRSARNRPAMHKKRTDATTGCRCVGKVGKDGFEPPKA